MLESVVEEKLLARAAMDRGLNREPAFRDRLRRLRYEQEQALRIYREEALAEILLERLRSNELRVSDEEIANYYKEQQRLYRVRHILLADKEKAAQLHAELKQTNAGLLRRFSRMARKESLDAASAKEGGKLAPFMKGEFDDAFEASVVRLESGQLSEVVESSMGYHLIYSEGSTLVLFADEIRERCRYILERKKLRALVKQWKQRFRLEVYDETLRPFVL